VKERLTTAQIARHLGCGANTVARRLRGLGVRVRPRGPNLERNNDGPGVNGPRWTPDLAWVVGLMATDGNLARVGHGLTLTSQDVDLLESARRCLALTNRLGSVAGGWGSRGRRLQWRSRALYEWLVGVGLTPRKSLTLGPLRVPDEYFADFFRGCVDGDGTVLVYVDRYHTIKKASYVYTRLYVSLVSASRPFIDWVRATIYRLLGLLGDVHVKRKPGRRPVWVLRYAKKGSRRLLSWMYYAPDVPCLGRKRAKAEPFISGVK
jgi:hypothetical protein